MISINESLKRFCVAIGYGSSADDYEGDSVEDILKELAVNMECAPSVDSIRSFGIAETLDFIAANKGSEEKEPYDLGVTATHATVTVKKGNKTLSPASDILYNGDKLKITAAADGGYTLSTLTLNGEEIESGDSVVVNGHNIAIVATAETSE